MPTPIIHLCFACFALQITYLIVADMLVATVITILQLLQHIVSLKLGAFVANCRIVTVSKPRDDTFPTRVQRIPISLPPSDREDDNLEQSSSIYDSARPSTTTDQGKSTHTQSTAGTRMVQVWERCMFARL